MRRLLLVFCGLTMVAGVLALVVLFGGDGAGAESIPLGPSVVVTPPSSPTPATSSGAPTIAPTAADGDEDGAPAAVHTVGPGPASAVENARACEKPTVEHPNPEDPCPAG